jgi:hypothetical protein
MYDLNKLPEGFKLLQTPGKYRTMHSVIKGETIRFKYNSGSNPGYRTVLVVNKDETGFSGVCLERGCEWRRFLFRHCDGGHECVLPFVKIEEKEVVKKERKVTVLKQPVMISPKVEGTKNKGIHTVLTFTNKHGKILEVETFNDASVGYTVDGVYYSAYNPLEFAADLTKFLS